MLKSLHSIADSLLKKMQRSSFYYKKYNNTLSPKWNQSYMRYARECSAHYASLHGSQEFQPSPLRTTGAKLVQNAISADKARAHVAKITELIENNDEAVDYKDESGLSIGIKEPIKTLGTDLLDCFRSPEVHNAFVNYFHGHYRIEWATCYRSVPSKEIAGSWFWHTDSYPPHTCKMFLHLTPANADTGATELMSLEDTLAYHHAGYFGQYMSERKADLEDFAKEHNLPYRPVHFDANPGDVTLLNVNFLHRAVAPRTQHRDIISFFLVPNLLPWEEQLERDGVDSITIDGGLRIDPHPRTKKQLAGAAM